MYARMKLINVFEMVCESVLNVGVEYQQDWVMLSRRKPVSDFLIIRCEPLPMFK